MKGHCWLIKSDLAGHPCEVFVSAKPSPTRVQSLGELINVLDQPPPPAILHLPDDSVSSIHRLA